jgi:hypothetical protein
MRCCSARSAGSASAGQSSHVTRRRTARLGQGADSGPRFQARPSQLQRRTGSRPAPPAPQGPASNGALILEQGAAIHETSRRAFPEASARRLDEPFSEALADLSAASISLGPGCRAWSGAVGLVSGVRARQPRPPPPLLHGAANECRAHPKVAQTTYHPLARFRRRQRQGAAPPLLSQVCGGASLGRAGRRGAAGRLARGCEAGRGRPGDPASFRLGLISMACACLGQHRSRPPGRGRRRTGYPSWSGSTHVRILCLPFAADRAIACLDVPVSAAARGLPTTARLVPWNNKYSAFALRMHRNGSCCSVLSRDTADSDSADILIRRMSQA